ncbi:MAG: hypothetical protein IJW70_00750 [Clostridia bacterium]|nr:hypothetical protein [Clostridia bacterium]
MPNYNAIVEQIQQFSTYSEKGRFLSVLLNSMQNKRNRLGKADKQALAQFALEEVSALLTLIPVVESYKQKTEIFDYEDSLMGLIMFTHDSPAQIPEANLQGIKALVELVNRERFVENAVDAIFSQPNADMCAVDHLLCSVIPLKDEYQKSTVFQGLLHYQNQVGNLSAEIKQRLGDYVASEIERYAAAAPDESTLDALEIACDAAKLFPSDRMTNALYAALKSELPNVCYYAMASLLDARKQIPDQTVNMLANDIIYANLTYLALRKHRKTAAFPAELSTPEYLAKSDLVHWLTYPTELGQVPDQIEYLGKVSKKGEYYVFRYKSNSDTLSDDLKGQWLIGWSNDDGGTFSNFDLYEQYEKKTPEKTLAYIKRKLL